MRRDPRARLFAARAAADAAVAFTSGIDFAQYQSDEMRRSAVERQLEIIGEALRGLSRESPALVARIPDVPEIVAMRNLLIHGYDLIDDEVVWKTVQDDLPRLSVSVAALLAELDAAAE